jgi:hypothetical protein
MSDTIEAISGISLASIESLSGKSKSVISKVGCITKPSGGSGIINDNLYQYYDASNSNSYIGSGTAWNDLQGNYDLTLIGGPTYVSSQPAHFDFDFVNDRARGASNYGANFDDMSVEVWFRADNINTRYRYSLAAALDQPAGNRRFLLNIERGAKLRFIPFGSTGSNLGTLLTTATFSAGTWYYVCATKSGTTSTIYINGSSSTSMTLNNSTLGTCNLFGVAERQLSSLDLFNGDIAKVRVYSDALTSSEVSTNYNAEKSYFGHT